MGADTNPADEIRAAIIQELYKRSTATTAVHSAIDAGVAVAVERVQEAQAENDQLRHDVVSWRKDVVAAETRIAEALTWLDDDKGLPLGEQLIRIRAVLAGEGTHE